MSLGDIVFSNFFERDGKIRITSGKRLLRELEQLQEDKSIVTVSVNVDTDKNIQVKLFDLKYVVNNEYIFNVPLSYPFNAPSLSIFDDFSMNLCKYTDFLRVYNDDFRKYIKKSKGLNCLCCHSYLCSDNWNPSVKIIDFINEIRIFRSYKRSYLNKIFAIVIKRKYLIEDIDINTWLE